jgi:hypothetical protein
MAEYGLYPVLLLAGFLGSLVYLAAQDGPPTSIWLAVSPIMAGTLSANYLPHFALSYISEAVATGGGAMAGAFTTGLCGPLCARLIIRRLKGLISINNGKVS